MASKREKTQQPAPRFGFCFSCERYLGTAPTCPYCGERALLPPPLLWLRRAAWCFALIGIFLVWLAARESSAPHVYATDLGPEMSYARVSLSGVVDRPPYVRRESGEIRYASFLLDDGTGMVRVVLHENVAATTKLPCALDIVNVTGTIRIRAGRTPQLSLESANHLRTTSPPAETS